MMLPHDVAAMLEKFATDVEHIRGVSSKNPHVFVEDKSDVVGAMRAKAKELRTVTGEPKPASSIRPGVIEIPASLVNTRRREVRVEVRGGCRAPAGPKPALPTIGTGVRRA